MKLPIKKIYFDQIKKGRKTVEYRDAHITFVCEKTGETLRKDIITVGLSCREKGFYSDVLEDENMILFTFKSK